MSEHQSTSQVGNRATVTVTLSSDELDTHTQGCFTRTVIDNCTSLRFRRFTSNLSRDGPLKDIKVLDLTRIVAGPYCTMILGDLGADVIKIEKPGTGDEARNWGPPYVKSTDETCYFMCLNRNKRSVCVDMKSNEGKEIILQLAKKSDVLVENYVPGTLKKLGLDYDSIKNEAPHLIYCSITGYGSTGPYKNRPGYDVIAASIGGLLSITGPINGPPCKVGVAMTDMATGLYAHGAILAALIEKNLTGKGQKIDCNLLSTQVACLINIGSNYLNSGEIGKKWGSSHVSIAPYRAYETADGGFITVGSGSNLQFQNLCEKLELFDLYQNNMYKTNKDRVKNREALDTILEEKFKTKSLKDWLNIFKGANFPYGPVNDMSQVFTDDHIQEISIVKEIQHPRVGTIKLVGPPVEFSMSKNSIYSAPPLLGQHTNEVLTGILDYSDEMIQELRKKGDLTAVKLKLRKPKSTKKVNWTKETVDNENMDKKKSKCCCIYQKPRAQDESSSSDETDENECEHCFGHVEKKKLILQKHNKTPSPDPTVQSMITA